MTMCDLLNEPKDMNLHTCMHIFVIFFYKLYINVNIFYKVVSG